MIPIEGIERRGGTAQTALRGLRNGDCLMLELAPAADRLLRLLRQAILR